MKLPRRQFLRLSLGVVASAVISHVAGAQSYPVRAVRLIVGFAAGNTTDMIARLMGQRLSESLNQPFVIDNRPGAGSYMGLQAVARTAPDGYTLLLVTSTNAIGVSLTYKLDSDFTRDIAPVGGIGRVPSVMVVNPSVPARSVPDFIAFVKANPGKINMASTGIGNFSHVSGELFKMLAGVDMVHMPYRGASPALIDLLEGRVQVMFDTLPASIEHIRSGKVRALAVGSAMRSQLLPEVPVMSDFVPGYEANGWYGIGVPRKTPGEIVETLNREINAALADARVTTRFAELGTAPLGGSPHDFDKFIGGEVVKWAKVIKFAGITPV